MIRYPDGDFEVDFTRSPSPLVGETVRRKGELWNVKRITQAGTVVHVERVTQAQAPEREEHS